MKKVPVKEAVGSVLAHDLTKIEPGKSKEVPYKKGHKITAKDVPELLKMGKENIYIYHLEEGKIHEDEGAMQVARILKGENEYIEASSPSEGKISLTVKRNGILKIDKVRLESLNKQAEIVAVTSYNNKPVKKGDTIAQTRIVPLLIEAEKIDFIKKEVFKDNNKPVIDLMHYKKLSASLIVTGSEVYHGRIEDGFSPVVKAKLESYGSTINNKVYLPDDEDMIKKTILEQIKNSDMLIITGGMSVDPDDVTPGAIKKTGAEIITYGAPLLPGTMMMLAYLDDKPVFGLPGCVMYAHTTAFDVFLPRVLTGEKIDSKEIAAMGHGGLCFRCEVCSFWKCGFGQG